MRTNTAAKLRETALQDYEGELSHLLACFCEFRISPPPHYF